MENFFEKITSGGTDFLIDLIVSLLILIVGFKIVGMLEKSFKKEHKFSKLDPSVKSFIVSFIITIFRHSALKNDNEMFYKISSTIYEML